MRKLAVEQAVGETLCHDMTAILEDGFKGVRFSRGHVIREEDIEVLRDMGKRHVFVWEPQADEVHEDDAAAALVDVLIGEGITRSAPTEGKIGLSALYDGLFLMNKPALRGINSVGDYTVACRNGNTPVKAGDKLGGARIVPLVTKRSTVEQAVLIARENAPVLSVLPGPITSPRLAGLGRAPGSASTTLAAPAVSTTSHSSAPSPAVCQAAEGGLSKTVSLAVRSPGVATGLAVVVAVLLFAKLPLHTLTVASATAVSGLAACSGFVAAAASAAAGSSR